MHIHRALGGQALPLLEPFLLLEEFQSDDPNEPVARRGLFVMNTDDELRQAYDDYRAGVLTAGI